MLVLFRILSLRYLTLRWERAILVILSIALGVATLVSTRVLNRVIETISTDAATPLAGADLFIGNGEQTVDRDIARLIEDEKIPGVKTAMPLLLDRVWLVDGDKPPVPMSLLGADFSGKPDAPFPKRGETIRDETLKASFTRTDIPEFQFLLARPVAVSRAFLDARVAAGFAANDPIALRFGTRKLSCLPAVVIDFDADSPAVSLARNLVGMELSMAIEAFRPPLAPNEVRSKDRVTRIDVYLEKKTDPLIVAERIRTLVGDRAKVRTPEAQRKSTEEIVGGIQIGFTLCSIGAMIVGMFLVYNALSVSVAERRHDIGILRALGATRNQIATLFAAEAILLGGLGGAIGVPMGGGLAKWAIGQVKEELTSALLSGDSPPTEVLPWMIFLALGAGMITALFAALIPAWQAASDQPAEAVRRATGSGGNALRRIHQGACLLLIGGGMAMILLRDLLPPRTGGYVGVVMALVGLFLAMPYFVSALAWAMQPVFRAVLGVEARLAADNLVRAPGRTGLVIGALAAGVSLMYQTAGVGMSNEIPIRQWLTRVLQADAFVLWGDLATANNSMTPMEPALAGELRGLGNVEKVIGIRFIRPEYNDTLVFMLALDAVAYKQAIESRVPVGGRNLSEFTNLPGQPAVVVSDNFALRHKVGVGDYIELPAPKGKVRLKILGTAEDYSWNRGTIFIDRATYAELFDDPWVDIYHVFFDKSKDDAATMTGVRDYAGGRGLIVQDKKFIDDYLLGVIDRLYTLAYVQQMVIAIVAALGVVTALLISVIQRQRELGLLRAVGATKIQVLRSVIAEAVLMGILGVILGLALGWPMEWYILKVVMYEESGFLFDALIPWTKTLWIGVFAVFICALAGLLPALRAMQLNIPEAIAWE